MTFVKYMEKPKGKNRVWKRFKLIEETTKQLEERSKVENMNESEYIRYLFLKSVGTSKEQRAGTGSDAAAERDK